MMEMICKTPHMYRQRHRVVGERFEVDDRDVKILIALGRAEVQSASNEYRTRDTNATQQNEYRTRHIPAAPKRKRGRPRKGA